MTRYFCHECALEDNDFPTNAQGPVCPRCQGAFVEEIPQDESGADDPRDFDPDDDGEEGGGGGLPFNLFGGGGAGGVGAGGPAFFQFIAQPGGGPPIITAGGGAQAGLNPLTMAMLQALGMAPPPQGVRAPPLRRVQSEGAAEQPRAGQAGEAEGDDRREQVPLRNLAAFLGEAFGGGPRQPHPTDDPANNPFAEGGHETPRNDDAQQPGSPNAAGPQQQQRDGAAPPPNPLNHLLSLLNVFGLNTQVLGGGLGGFGLRANAGDYAWGSEADFQQLLNDLMEQASLAFPRAAGRAGPQPAPDDMIEKLPRLKVSQDLLDMSTVDSCGICLDAFQLSDSAVALPCKHLYHEDCLVPWLKTSGTCPTCRFALVPQPGQPGYEANANANDAAGEGGTDGAGDPANAHPTASTSTSTSPSSSPTDQPPRRPSLPSRQSTLNPLSPSTARIPEIAGGSSLPGSWIWPAGEGEGEGEGAMDVDGDPEEVEAGASTSGEREARRAAALAAERRAEEARGREEQERMRVEEEDKSLEEPVIEDVD
ncbi:hypothetical protein NBRC10512_002846 [Rhodotorula toruloides]|uniref:E3 ubiquitin-protein ligase RNF115/126 n=1 Tax=Rhodotorula toruloides (strain NP11) TaxID=1130832 RepID=M7WQZ2_RHOT1|nr:E3 ubiquitin-protein ligase RNF115/126 [Rhodotorula toruloides NP11]EMS20290.1 E3 ubiquitin-protein ligase RNF115/126 [Rhodotorula toruloides NP11]